ncbi:DUF6934 family protein [Marinoscillum sp.]|uniref:DUF6934 family protein n=1 Tax=Marinoscillum sp. TaxID=2024838 RepID=UPI003BA96DB5
MNYERYESVFGSKDSLEFEFTSIGARGAFKKIIQFTPTSNPGIYNLGFGVTHMKAKKKLEGASKLGVKVHKDSKLDTSSKKVLFPEKLEFANKVVANLKLKTH